MNNTLHDLEDDTADIIYGIGNGSNLDTNKFDKDEIADCAERIGTTPYPIAVEH